MAFGKRSVTVGVAKVMGDTWEGLSLDWVLLRRGVHRTCQGNRVVDGIFGLGRDQKTDAVAGSHV